jgi:hypothetical protein
MNIKTRSFVLVLFIFFLIASIGIQKASADQKVSLITVSEGADLLGAFGDSLVLVRDENSEHGWLYIYDRLSTDAFTEQVKDITNPFTLLIKFFNSKFQTKPTKNYTHINATHGLPEALIKAYLIDQNSYREAIMDEINLSTEQTIELIKLMDQDVDPTTPAREFDKYKANTVTRFRDRLFEVLDPKLKFTAETNMLQTSYRLETMKSLDRAEALSLSKSITLFPQQFTKTDQGQMILESFSMAGIKTEFKSTAKRKASEQVYDVFKKIKSPL